MAPKRFQNHNSASRLKNEHLFASPNHITPLPTQRDREVSLLWERVHQWQGGLEEDTQLQEKELGDATAFLHPSRHGVSLFSWTAACSPGLLCPLISPHPPLTPESCTKASSTPSPHSPGIPAPQRPPHTSRGPREPPERPGHPQTPINPHCPP